MRTIPLTITSPDAPGRPAILNCATFEGHLDRFEDALAAKWAAEFPGTTLEQLGIKAGADSGFERFWAACVALGDAAGARAGRVEAQIAQHRVAATAAAAPKVVATFESKVREQVARGLSKSAAVSAVAHEFPELHAQAVKRGIPTI